jgi:two-component system NtrC family response regulator
MKKNVKPPSRLKVLFADDEPTIRSLIQAELPRMGHQVTVCADGAAAAAELERNAYDCVLVDLDMPGLNGIQVIERAKELAPETEAVVLTGKSSLDSAIAALRQGAFDYLTKPCRLVELESLLMRIAQKRELKNRYRALKNQLERLAGQTQLVGTSAPLERVRQLIAKVAPTNSTVLILGETGTGKELVARSLHEQSLRSDQPFVAINCGALPETLIESELFGHRKGAFTGADEHRVGLFEVAHGGTLFLDEIGELPKAMQAKLLRVLERGEIRRIGHNESFCVDVRVICATHRNLSEMAAAGEFREDLMYRINTFEILLPPLRLRSDDIPELAEHLYRRFCPALPPDAELFTPAAIDVLKSHTWPGNVRELANVIEHATILSEGPPLTPDDLPRTLDRRPLRVPELGPVSLRELEMVAIHQALDRHEGNKASAAEELGVSLKTLYNKLNQAAAEKKSA